MPFSCAMLGHFLRSRAAEEIYFGNTLVAAALLALQWLVAKKKRLINEDDPHATRLMGQRVVFLPVALSAAMVGSYFSFQAGSYAMAFTLIALRLWQKRWHSNQIASPANPSS
jgi:uncharacterized membrane protein